MVTPPPLDSHSITSKLVTRSSKIRNLRITNNLNNFGTESRRILLRGNNYKKQYPP